MKDNEKLEDQNNELDVSDIFSKVWWVIYFLGCIVLGFTTVSGDTPWEVLVFWVGIPVWHYLVVLSLGS